MQRMQITLVGLAVLCSAWSTVGDVPTDNPVATFYGPAEGHPAWTDRVRWNRVIDMSAYAKGKTNFEKFENARDELAAVGGGVLYYPAGVYDFSDGPFDGPNGRGLMLKSGVVIRGERPPRDPVARDGSLDLRTKFVFGRRVKRRTIELVLADAVQLTKSVRASRRGPSKKVTTNYDVHVELRLEQGRPHPDAFVAAPGLTKQDFQTARIADLPGGGWRIEVAWVQSEGGKLRSPRTGQFVITAKPQADGYVGTWTATYEKTGAETGSGALTGAPGEPYVVPRDWNLIGLHCPSRSAGKGVSTIDDVGVAWVHLQRAVVYFGPEMRWAPTWAQCVRRYRDANVWSVHSGDRSRSTNETFLKPLWRSRQPDGTHPWDPFTGSVTGDQNYVGAGRGRLVFGCVLEDAAVLNDSHDLGAGPDGFYMMKFARRIAAYGSRVFVANNVLPASKSNFRYSQHTTPAGGRSRRIEWKPRREEARSVLWDYGKVCGIEINKDLVGNRHRSGLWETGVVVRDNYVFNHGQKGVNVSGTWVTIRDNVNDRIYLREGADVYGLGPGWELTIDGAIESAPGGAGPISDNYSRPFDLAGANLWVDGNWSNNSGSDPGNDGETILCQRYRGTHWPSWSVTHNVHERGEGEPGYIGGWAVATYGSLIAWNTCPGAVGSLAAGGFPIVDAAFVANDAARVDPSRPTERQDVLLVGDGRPLTPPTDVRATVADGDAVQITWTDASDNEIGFRIDRRIDAGPWTTIAYRPRHSRGHRENPQAWLDVTVPAARKLTYRVVAIDETDSDTGAAPAMGVTIPSLRTK